MLQHLLIGMYAPLAIVLSAPLTLLFRIPVSDRLTTARIIPANSATAQVLGHPASPLR